jgi:hypothetical protein
MIGPKDIVISLTKRMDMARWESRFIAYIFLVQSLNFKDILASQEHAIVEFIPE